MSDERRTRELYASLDGELTPWRHFLLRRRLARDPAARREIATLREIGALMREEAGESAAPDLWDGIAARLPYAEAPTRSAETKAAARATNLPSWAGAGLAAAAVALALVFFAGGGPAEGPLPGSVEWLDSGGRATLVLQDDAEATIIWVLPETAKAQPADGRIEHGRV